jgi:hypothetical protein
VKKIVVIATGRMGGDLRDGIRKKNVAHGFNPRIACGQFFGIRP